MIKIKIFSSSDDDRLTDNISKFMNESSVDGKPIKREIVKVQFEDKTTYSVWDGTQYFFSACVQYEENLLKTEEEELLIEKFKQMTLEELCDIWDKTNNKDIISLLGVEIRGRNPLR